MPSLVDDVDTITSGSNFPTAMEKGAKKVLNQIPKPFANMGKAVFMTEDTQGFKLLNNAVKMTDYVGRHVLYHHYVEQGMSHADAVAAVTEEFVDFNIPTHKMIEYFNSIGFLWFTKYGLRILKVIKNSVADKPYDAFMAFMLSSHVGLDNILNSVPGVTKDVFAPLGDPFSSAIGSLDEPFMINGLDEILSK